MKKIISLVLVLTMLCGAVCAFSSCESEETLVVYTESGFAPFEYVSNGKIVGVDVDIMNMVGEKLGKKVVFKNVDFDVIVNAVSEGKLTNVGAAGISVTDARKALVDFSTEYYTANLYVIYSKANASSYESTTTDNVTGVYWDSLAGKNIAVQGGTTADLFLKDEIAENGTIYGTGANRTVFDSLGVATASVGTRTDVLIIDELPAKQLIKNRSDLACAPLYYQGGEGENDEAAIDTYAICVTKGQDELLKAINDVLAELGEEGIQALVNKHLGITE